MGKWESRNSAGLQILHSGKSDSAGNLIVLGSFCGNIDLGCSPLTGGSMFIVKFDANGNCIWENKAGAFGTVTPDGFAIDNFESIYISGENSGQAFFDNDTIAAGGFIAKYDSSGSLIWVKNKFRYLNQVNTSEIYPYDIKVFNSHLLVIGDAINDTLIIDTITVLNPQIVSSPFIASFDLNGNVEWFKTYGGNNAGGCFKFSMDNSGNSYITGLFNGTGYFGADTLTAGSSGDAFITKIDSNGNFIWTKQLNASNGAWGIAALTSPGDGNTYVTGYFKGSASFGNYNITSTATQDMFLARYDNDGNCIGVRSFGYAVGNSIAQDSNGNPYVCGTFQNTITIGSNTFTSFGYDDIFVAKCDAFTGIDENERKKNNRLLIYANPNSGKCNITVPDDFVQEQQLTLSIFDNAGKLIQQKNLEMNDGIIKLNLEAEAKGVYSVTLTNGRKTYSGKVVFE